MTRLPTMIAATLLATAAPAQEVRQISTHMGEMTVEAGGPVEVDDALRFEPYQQLEEMFMRDDVVFLMRHGPTDWSKLDEKGVAPDDCANQRILSPDGTRNMRDLGALMAVNDILPAEIVVSQWCRNQQTLSALLEGMERIDASLPEAIPHRTEPGLNLLLSLRGSTDVSPLRALVSGWEGSATRPGPLLVVSHYTNIEELTQFRVFEGEFLVLDPKRDNYVLGYVRLKSAQPDVGHFADALASPLLERDRATDMVERYYAALVEGDADTLRGILSPEWVDRGPSPSVPDGDTSGFLDEIARITAGLSDADFSIDDLQMSDDTITVRGTVTGRHTGDLFGVPATGRDVAFGGIALHRIEDGAIAESWQMVDWTTLMSLIRD
ncbi:ester cyclase [Jannaschia sp. Os4]|uniref:ester cyclase n=1 Tax=Jannaschia sp. Os4 TaxID=2807617 RepID=UPI0019394BC8|nr:ester cyclase [Jannaschia sp. Os4]MBM2576377.1 ester cyclase [Jannaschia sp. Os4]